MDKINKSLSKSFKDERAATGVVNKYLYLLIAPSFINCIHTPVRGL